jgi:CheY-like chemotaxis protein
MSLNTHSSERLYDPAPPQPRNGDNHVVLIVLDRIEARLELGQVLKSKGYSVVDTDHGQEAVRQARQTKPDLVVVDLDVPLLYGLVAARQIIRQAQLGPLPVVIVAHEAVIDPAPMIEISVTRNEYITRLSDYAELHHLLEYLLPVLPRTHDNASGKEPYLRRAEAIRLQPLPASAPVLHTHQDGAHGKPAANQTQFAYRPPNYRL